MKEKTLSEKRKEIIERLDNGESWKNTTRRRMVQDIMETITYQDKQFIKEILEDIDEWVEDSVHYKTECGKCGRIWGSLHCPHDGVQGRCPDCNTRPEGYQEGECYCEFWLDHKKLKEIIKQKAGEFE